MNTKALNEASSLTSLLTVLSALPYEKDLIGIIPAAWAPRLIAIGAISTILLRLLPRILAIFGVKMPEK